MDRNELLSWIQTAGVESFSRSGGPGGQNVNKVNTKVTLKLRVNGLPDITEEELSLLLGRLSNRINAAGELVVQASEYRSQAGNRRSAQERAADLILTALRPQVVRPATRPGRKARERRLNEKRQQSLRKKNRRPPEME